MKKLAFRTKLIIIKCFEQKGNLSHNKIELFLQEHKSFSSKWEINIQLIIVRSIEHYPNKKKVSTIANQHSRRSRKKN